MEKEYNAKSLCKKTTRYCDQSQYETIGLWNFLKMKIHLLLCVPCRAYSKKNSALTESIKKSNIRSLKADEIREIKQRLDQEIRE